LNQASFYGLAYGFTIYDFLFRISYFQIQNSKSQVSKFFALRNITGYRPMKTTILILLSIVVCHISTTRAQQEPVEPSVIEKQVTQAAENLIAAFDDA